MPPKDITGYSSNQKAKEDANPLPHLSQLACSPTSIINQSQNQSQTRPPSYSDAGRQHFNDYPSLNNMITPSSGSSHSGNYHQQSTVGSLPASNLASNMGSGMPHSSYFTHPSMSASQVSGQQRIPVGSSYHQQAPVPSRDDQRHTVSVKHTPVLSTPSFAHTQQPEDPPICNPHQLAQYLFSSTLSTIAIRTREHYLNGSRVRFHILRINITLPRHILRCQGLYRSSRANRSRSRWARAPPAHHWLLACQLCIPPRHQTCSPQ